MQNAGRRFQVPSLAPLWLLPNGFVEPFGNLYFSDKSDLFIVCSLFLENPIYAPNFKAFVIASETRALAFSSR